MPKLYFPIGISGSGKSTYIKKHFKPEIVVSPDELRRQFTGDVTDHTQEGKVWATVPILLKQKLDKYGEAVLDATNVDSGSRAGLLKKFSRDFVERIAIVFEADPEESKRRIHADLEAGKDRSDVPDEVVDKQQEKFRRGFNTIKQQFDKVIYADRGENVMSDKITKEDIEKVRKIVNEEMKRLKEEDAQEAQERAQYQSYQDMYLVPQSNWKLKKYANMYDANGNLYRGKLGEVHRLQTVEYDFMHTGEVVTECGDETYSIDAEDFRECFEMAHDEEGLKVNNENVMKEEIKKLVKIKDYFGKNIKGSIERLEEAFLTEDDIWKKLTDILQKLKAQSTYLDGREEDELNGILETFGIIKVGDELELPNGAARNAYEALKNFYEGVRNRSSKREPEDAYLDQDFEDRISGDPYDDLTDWFRESRVDENAKEMQYVIKNIMSGKKYYASRVNSHGNIEEWNTVSNPFSNDIVLKFDLEQAYDILSKRSKWMSDKIFVVDSTGQEFGVQFVLK